MKKFFFFAAALVAAMTVNAEVYNLCVVDTTSTDAAKTSIESAFTFSNATVAGKLDSKSKPYAEVTQTDATADWTTTVMEYKANTNLKFYFKDSNANKLVLKCYVGYMQPNGASAMMQLSGFTAGEKVNIVLKSNMNAVKLVGVDGGDKDYDLKEGNNVFTMSTGVLEMYSKNGAGTTTKWQIVSVLTGKDAETTGINDNAAAVKATKIVENGQVVIVKGGKKYNTMGAEL